MFKVMVVEDQRMMRDVFETYINKSEEFVHIVSIANASLAEMNCMYHKVDLVLMDVCTENDESGFEATRVLKKNFPKIKVIIVTSMLDFSYIEKAREVRADSIWFKEASREELLSIMRRTMEGENIYPEKTPEVKIGCASSYEFSEAELRVLRLLVEGMTYKEMAEELGISPNTVKEHVRNMLSKTGFTSKTKLAAVVTSKKLVVNGF